RRCSPTSREHALPEGWRRRKPPYRLRRRAGPRGRSGHPPHRDAAAQEALPMATPFLSSEEYDERAHELYNDGDFDAALETLKEGLLLYPASVELYGGLGYTRLAREEFAWAREAFEKSLVLDPYIADALIGLGEV